ncbi:ABC transporter ATP-binding protein [Xiamenia xianingshaonis]|uniref:ATP-binding cassette domain-containing protein n=1 Tax=Xiamenia xianingshaonis TaxID=2682776 RepID=A0ABX0IIR1_9ACTN|nr:ABC transporter ATP-binding protein [Xiamenia xianingshaonis]NHM14731.1 ATP-binding cassette domain-containing protein [Xiamenia xianingshaonis]
MSDAVRVEHLSKSFGSIDAVKDVSFAVPAGTAFGLLGPNGSGKSTVVECIVGTKVPDKGTVEVLQLDPIRERRRLFQRCGVQFQDCDYQPEIKVSELCEEFACLYDSPADWRELCNRFGIGDKTAEAVKSLSGGQRQRLFVALALLPDPEVVFLDELTTGLDAAARRSVWEILNDLKRDGMTLFLVSHFMDEVEAVCDRICILEDGAIAFMGTPEEAKAATGEANFEEAYLVLSGKKGE